MKLTTKQQEKLLKKFNKYHNNYNIEIKYILEDFFKDFMDIEPYMIGVIQDLSFNILKNIYKELLYEYIMNKRITKLNNLDIFVSSNDTDFEVYCTIDYNKISKKKTEILEEEYNNVLSFFVNKEEENIDYEGDIDYKIEFTQDRCYLRLNFTPDKEYYLN